MPINWYTSPMMIHKTTPFCRLQFVVETSGHLTKWTTNQNSMKVPKVVSKRLRKRFYKTMGTIGINSPMSPPSQIYNIWKLVRVENTFQTIYPWLISLPNEIWNLVLLREGEDIRRFMTLVPNVLCFKMIFSYLLD